jgi:MFS family permease
VTHNFLPADRLPPDKEQTPRSGRRFAVYKWVVVGMLWFICFFNYADRQSINSVFPRLEAEFGFDEFQLGMIGSAFMWVYAIGAPFAGYVGDRLPRKHLILGGCLFWSAVTAMTGWCQQLWQFIAVRALEGGGETFYVPASMSLVSDYHDRRTRSLAMAFHQSSVYAGTIGGSYLGAWFAEYYGWRVGFYFFGLSGLVLALVLFSVLREPARGEADTAAGDAPPPKPLSLPESLRTIFRSPMALVLMGGFLGANFVAAIFLTWTPTFLVKKFDFKLTTAGLSGAVFIHAASALSVSFSGALADYLGQRLRGGRVIVQACGLLIGSVFVYMVGYTTDVSVLIGTMILFGLCKGVYDANIFASLYDFVEPRSRATAAGVMNFVGWGGGAFGPLAVGWVAVHGPSADRTANMSMAISWCGAIYLACGVLLFAGVLFLARGQTPPLVQRAGSTGYFPKNE